MISNTTEIFFIVYCNKLLHKICFFSSCKKIYFIYDPFSCLINVFFAPYFYGKFCHFFKCLLNFRAHNLQLKLNKVGYTKFVKFWLQRMSSKMERAFENDKKCFCLHFANSKFNFILSAFSHLLIFIFHILNLH